MDRIITLGKYGNYSSIEDAKSELSAQEVEDLIACLDFEDDSDETSFFSNPDILSANKIRYSQQRAKNIIF